MGGNFLISPFLNFKITNKHLKILQEKIIITRSVYLIKNTHKLK
jgi:hypothetical protein